MSFLESLARVTNFLVKREENIRRAFDYLNRYGYIDDKQEENVVKVIETIKRLQKMGGLPQTGELDAKTLQLMEAPRCAVTDKESLIEFASQPNRWGLTNIAWYVAGYDTEVSKTEWIDTIAAAFNNWHEVCKLDFTQVQSASNANIILDIGSGRADDFDGPSGTLAWMSVISMPNFKGQHKGKFDRDETWIPKGKTGRGIFLENVATHEIGHSLIGSHSTNAQDLMASFYSPSVVKPQAGDRARATNLYGSPTTVNPPPVTPPPIIPPPVGEDEEIVIRLKGKGASVSVDGYRLSKIG